jgi:hypothetical protein
MIDTIKSTNTALIFSILTPLYVMASDTSLINNLKTCAVIKKEAVRLQCFDDLTNKADVNNYKEELTINQGSESEINSSEIYSSEVDKANALVAKSKLVDTQARALTAEQIDDFSKEQVKKTPQQIADQVNTIELTISKLSKSVRGQWQIYFTNGQHWQQKDNINLRLKVGDQVKLTKGGLGAVFLKKHDINKRIKVRRLK